MSECSKLTSELKEQLPKKIMAKVSASRQEKQQFPTKKLDIDLLKRCLFYLRGKRLFVVDGNQHMVVDTFDNHIL